jgi:hypothetical protein
MMTAARLIGATLAFALLSGCAPTGLYNWGSYEKDLYLYYKDPQNIDEYSAELASIVEDDTKADRVPPGMYAEYGYILYEQGDIEKAREYFVKEKEKWPESAAFMDLAIQNLTGGITPQYDTAEPTDGDQS